MTGRHDAFAPGFMPFFATVIESLKVPGSRIKDWICCDF
jgi:hypothetical protein